MFIQSFPSGPLATNSYIVACPKIRLAAIIDPAPESSPNLISFLAEHDLKLEKILLTHSHWDHIADVAPLVKKYAVPVYIHANDEANLISPGADRLPCWIDVQGVRPDGHFKEGDILTVGELRFKVIETPGHTPGGVCFYCQAHKKLISGDTLFKGSIGNISFPTSRPDLMWDSLKKLSKLPSDTTVYPGHGPTTKIGDESWLSDAESVFGSY